ncbi:MAG: type IV pilus assembly protein PilQ [Flavobacteriales bacterium]|jgi:type IV pilus assembly protein PilQ
MYRFSVKLIILWVLSQSASALQINDISFAELPGERTEVRLSFDGAPIEPKGFSIDNPARIVLDFEGVENALAQKKYDVDVGGVNSAVVVSGGGRTRVIVNMSSSAPYDVNMSGNELMLVVGGGVALSHAAEDNPVAAVSSGADRSSVMSSKSITQLDFRRGVDGEGKILVSLSNPNVAVDVEEVADGINIRFVGVEIPNEFKRKLDVVDFATPVKVLSASSSGRDAIIHVEASGDYDYLAYQADDEYVVSVKPLTEREIIEKEKVFAYTGERLSLNFQDVKVRSVLQVLADSADLNLVASDTVRGSITLRLHNVPWDQALDIILKAKGLDKRQQGNVLMVAPAAEIAERERQEVATKKQIEELAPLRTEYIRIRYANAVELFALFSRRGGGGGASSGGSSGGSGASTGSILSSRGSAIVDERTNSIILTDTADKIAEFKSVVERIDIPIQQVMIEARIVIANNDFRKELGVRISGNAVDNFNSNDRTYEFGGSMEGLYPGDRLVSGLFTDADGDGLNDTPHSFPQNSIVDLGVFNPAGAIATNIIGSKFILGLELSALQESGFAEIVSQPKVITGDKQQATIESGTEIPYRTESASGGATIAFKDAVLKLDVTPQITPDNRIIMDLIINQDSISEVTSSGVPVIDVTQLETQVLVNDGDTVVLGGIYRTENVDGVVKVPLLGDIPFLGRLFRQDVHRESKNEILIFITPKILSSDYSE